MLQGYGWAGTYFFIDPTSGIAAVCYTQVIPTLDAEVLKVWKEAEEALYEGLDLEPPQWFRHDMPPAKK